MKQKLVSFILILLVIISSVCNIVVAEQNNLYPAAVMTVSGLKWGYIDQNGSFKISPVFSGAEDFNDKGVAVVWRGTASNTYNSIYFIDKAGKVISGPFSPNYPEFQDGAAVMRYEDGTSALVNDSGQLILKSNYNFTSYSEGLVKFYDKKLYGFMDKSGKIVIPAKFLSATDFSAGEAVVEVSASKYVVIDKTGKTLRVLKYYGYNTAGGLTSYYDEKTKLIGFKNADGLIVIKPQFTSTDYFEDGYAVVEMKVADYTYKSGLIDIKGNLIIPAQYSGITNLGQGLFAVSNSEYNYYSEYSPKAIFNTKGEKLTDFKYYNIHKFSGQYASACDREYTFFIDQEGNIVDGLPRLKGIGEMKIIDDIVKADLDIGMAYYKKSGELIWMQDNTIPLGNSITIKTITCRPDYLTFIQYPEVTGLPKGVQDSVNKKLKEAYTQGYLNNNTSSSSNDPEDEYLEDIDIGFNASLNKNLLSIAKNGYIYPLGAAHGMPVISYLYIDIRTGDFYELKDLFKANSKYAEKLTAIVNNQIKADLRINDGTYDVKETSVTADTDFIIGSDSLTIYYSPYEIACYAAGFPEFEIPYGQITNIIDTNGVFWNSFDKKIVNHKIKNLSGISNDKVQSIEKLMGNYEQSLITAVNNNSFAKVEPTLLPGSSLYYSQKKLVSDLYKRNIKEKLVNYQIYAIDKEYNSDVYKVYVNETAAIKYPNKNYVNKSFSWCYTVKPDKNGAYKLSDIVKW